MLMLEASSVAIAPPPARLLIHAEDYAGPSAHPETRWQWLRALFSSKDDGTQLRLSIVDPQGNVMLASDNAGALLDVVLPPGTYQVIAQFGKVRRGYTLNLAQGTSFDLYLRLAPDHR